MATQEQRLKRIADQLQVTYEMLRKAAANISGLLQLGRATCDEVKAYNLWALAIWNTQRGMLASLRAGGEPNVPADPGPPTLFVWKGVTGADAWKIDCSGQPSSLSGLMDAAMDPKRGSPYIDPSQMTISTTDPYAFNPESAPSFAQLFELVNQRAAEKQLGAIPAVVLIIGAIAVTVSIAIAAIMKFLEVNSVQEANTEQTALQARAYADYTGARLECFKQCTSGGKSADDCVETCAQLVAKPNIKIPGLSNWGTLQWIGFTVVAGAAGLIAYRIYQRKQAGQPIFELPEAP
jgi:hypothetical protein